MQNSIARNIESLRTEMAEACARAHRDPAEVRLMAVSKMHHVEALLEAYAAGQRLFGENRVQEWQAKHAATQALQGLEAHLIGPLQSNKSSRAAELFAAIDTVDSLRLATRLKELPRPWASSFESCSRSSFLLKSPSTALHRASCRRCSTPSPRSNTSASTAL